MQGLIKQREGIFSKWRYGPPNLTWSALKLENRRRQLFRAFWPSSERRSYNTMRLSDTSPASYMPLVILERARKEGLPRGGPCSLVPLKNWLVFLCSRSFFATVPYFTSPPPPPLLLDSRLYVAALKSFMLTDRDFLFRYYT